MELLKKVVVGIVSIVFLTGFSVGIISADVTEAIEDIPEQTNEELKNLPKYGSFSGTVTEIRNFVDTNDVEVEGKKYILVENSDGETSTFFVTEDTYLTSQTEITVGTELIGFYDSYAPTILIYPPQYTAIVIAANFPEEQSIKVDKFDEQLVSSDNNLKLNISEETEIISQDGTAFEGDIKNRDLVVIYDITTRSIPAQTSPLKVTVLSKEDIEAELQPELEEDVLPPIDLTEITGPIKEVVVNGSNLKIPDTFTSNEGILMIPLRAPAEALGYSVTWISETRSISINENISLSIGSNNYTNSNTTTQLETAPVLINGTTFVPVTFFNSVIGINNIFVINERLILDNSGQISFQ